MCSAADVGTECDNAADTRYRPQRILIYDRIAGGSGLSTQAAPVFAELLQAAAELVESCTCDAPEGCLGCVWYMGCAQYNQLLDKGVRFH
jgi:DEAD/DEAH box helicase domain-containing protein